MLGEHLALWTYNFSELGVAGRTGQAVLIAVPLVLALVTEYHVTGALLLVHGGRGITAKVDCAQLQVVWPRNLRCRRSQMLPKQWAVGTGPMRAMLLSGSVICALSGRSQEG